MKAITNDQKNEASQLEYEVAMSRLTNVVKSMPRYFINFMLTSSRHSEIMAWVMIENRRAIEVSSRKYGM